MSFTQEQRRRLDSLIQQYTTLTTDEHDFVREMFIDILEVGVTHPVGQNFQKAFVRVQCIPSDHNRGLLFKCMSTIISCDAQDFLIHP